jgi:hypothetical protein
MHDIQVHFRVPVLTFVIGKGSVFALKEERPEIDVRNID